jgi:hypothetical protein
LAQASRLAWDVATKVQQNKTNQKLANQLSKQANKQQTANTGGRLPGPCESLGSD